MIRSYSSPVNVIMYSSRLKNILVHVLNVEVKDGLEVHVTINIDFSLLIATPIPILLFDMLLNFLPYFLIVLPLILGKYISFR